MFRQMLPEGAGAGFVADGGWATIRPVAHCRITAVVWPAQHAPAALAALDRIGIDARQAQADRARRIG